MSERETVVELPFAADWCPCVEKLRTVLPLTVGIRDSAVQGWGGGWAYCDLLLGHHHQRDGFFALALLAQQHVLHSPKLREHAAQLQT
jgi:hypothetical protein